MRKVFLAVAVVLLSTTVAFGASTVKGKVINKSDVKQSANVATPTISQNSRNSSRPASKELPPTTLSRPVARTMIRSSLLR